MDFLRLLKNTEKDIMRKIKQLNREWRLRNREYDLKRKQEYSRKTENFLTLKPD